MMTSLDTFDQRSLHSERSAEVSVLEAYVRQFNYLHGSSESSREKSPCPICDQYRPVIFKKNQGDYSYCASCNVVFLSNPFTDTLLSQFYRGYPAITAAWHTREVEFYRNIYTAGIHMLTKHVHLDISTILDIGCSTGLFLKVCKEILPESLIYGIEPNLSERKIAEKHGITILGSEITEISGTTFDIITLWDVLEHIKRPTAYMKLIRSYMSSSSLLFLQIPSCDSISARILQEHCNMFDGIEHLSLFGVEGISTMLSRAGFTILDLTTVIADSFAINNYLNYDNPYLPVSSADTSTSILSDCFPSERQLLDSGLGYKIQLVARIS